MDRVTWRDRFRYAFDNFMARGTSALILGLFAVSLLLILVVAGLIALTGIANDQGFDIPTLIWRNLLRTLDPGTMGSDEGTAPFLAAMLLVTLGGIFIISTLIGIINSGLQDRLAELRKGRSRVVEQGHTVILGWSQQIHTVISEIVEANANQPRRSIVVLADRDPVEMEEEFRSRLEGKGTGRTRVVFRTGSPMDVADLSIASVQTSRAIIVLAPETEDPDADVIKSILAITNHAGRRPEPYHIVAEIRDRSNLHVARMVGQDEVQLILSEDVISKIAAQTCRQSGLSVVYAELLDFAGDEIYLAEVEELVGRTYGASLSAFADASPIGLLPAGGTPTINPPGDTAIQAGDRLIVIAADDDRIHLAAEPPPVVDEALLRNAMPRTVAPERTLLLGWNRRAPAIIRELDRYVAAGSTVMIVAASGAADPELTRLRSELANQRIESQEADSTDRAVLDGLGVEGFDHIIVLCYSDTLDVQRADARTLITLLHLRDIAARLDLDLSIVSEMLDVRDRALAEVTRADDFIISDRLISLLIAQVAENAHLNAVFADILDPEGSEIYLKPAGDYVVLDRPVPYAAIVESARRRGETAIGYRVASEAADVAAGYGVHLNQPKALERPYAADDRVIVVAEA
jgi:voltage-gated potassium channel Kch